MTMLTTTRGRRYHAKFHAPHCRACGVARWLATIEPHAPGHDLRTFRCLSCGSVEKLNVKYD